MAITDNRTHLIDGENNNNVSGDTDAAPTSASSTTGTVIEGTNSIAFQVDDAQEAIWFDQDTGEATFNIDLSDSTVYVMVKFGTPETRLGDGTDQLGGCICLKDAADGAGGDGIGYTVMGADVPGFPYDFGFFGAKLDVSVVAASPGTNGTDYYQYFGTEAGLAHNAVLQVGFGSFSLVKAVSTSPNAWFDGFYYIANDSYAASITGGTAITAETMADVAGDDVTSGLGMFNNPKGAEYGIFAPTEWGDSGTGSSYFEGDSEQWYFIGDNNGGHAVGANHFPMRLVGNGTGTNSWILTNIVMVNTGTESQFDMSNADMDTATMDTCTMVDFGTIQLPNATTKTTTNCTFLTCGEVTSNGGDMTGSSVLTPDITANDAGLIWDLNQDPDGELDDMTFTKTSGIAHHAIEFGTSIPTSSITLRGCAFGTDFSSSENTSPTAEAGDETFAFRDTTGTLTVNLVGCTGNFGYYSAGVVITIIADPVTTLLNVKDAEGNNEQDVQVWLQAKDGTDELPFEQAITSVTQAGGSPFTRTVTFTAAHGLKTDDYLSLSGITNATEDNSGAFQVTVTSTTVCTYDSADTGETTFTGTIIGTGGVLYGTTDASGNISSSRVWSADQLVVGNARKATSSPRFKPIEIDDTILAASGLTINRRLALDE